MNRYVPILQEYASPEIYDLEELVDRRGVLQLRLVDVSARKCHLSFDAYLAYRKLDEGDALLALAQLAATAKPGLSFYEVEASEFIAWFVAQSQGVRSADELTHYAIVTVDNLIDVLSVEAPSIGFEYPEVRAL